MLANAFQTERLSLVVLLNENNPLHNISSHNIAYTDYHMAFKGNRNGSDTV